ncbi:MAG: ATP-binding protein [Ardenticatenales bacterium]|nr:ATP-binding protein [Ardenticatenales bacterium]
MSTSVPIYVNNQPFFGRVEEQKQFRQALAEMRTPPRDETLPYIFLLFGDGGIGKTTLVRRFRDIATGERPFKESFQVLYLDWEQERWRPPFQGGREHVSAEAVFDALHDAATLARAVRRTYPNSANPSSASTQPAAKKPWRFFPREGGTSPSGVAFEKP